jgi:hypothetical protein
VAIESNESWMADDAERLMRVESLRRPKRVMTSLLRLGERLARTASSPTETEANTAGFRFVARRPPAAV